MATNPYFEIIFEFAFLLWWIFVLGVSWDVPKGDYCTVHPSLEALSRPVPIPSPRVLGTSPQSFIQSLQGRIYHSSIQSVIHSFHPPGIHVDINHSLPIWHITASLTLWHLFFGKMSCSSLLNWLICNWTCFPWTMLGCLYFCHIHLRTIAMHCCLSTLRQISVYLPHKGTPTWKATQMHAGLAMALQKRQKKAALFPKKATFACLHRLCSQRRWLHS